MSHYPGTGNRCGDRGGRGGRGSSKVCFLYQRGKCGRGLNCRFDHVSASLSSIDTGTIKKAVEPVTTTPGDDANDEVDESRGNHDKSADDASNDEVDELRDNHDNSADDGVNDEVDEVRANRGGLGTPDSGSDNDADRKRGGLGSPFSYSSD